jgi:hypothetical protein
LSSRLLVAGSPGAAGGSSGTLRFTEARRGPWRRWRRRRCASSRTGSVWCHG